jgi:UV DNA damage endonuclease
MGPADLPAHDARRRAEPVHLSTNLALLRDILVYLQANDIHMYRLHSALVPEGEDAEAQVRECTRELQVVGALTRAADVRLSFHPYSQVTLNALNQEQVDRSVALLRSAALILDIMGLGPEAVIVLHVGGVNGQAETTPWAAFSAATRGCHARCAAVWLWRTTTTASPGPRWPPPTPPAVCRRS